MRCAGAAGFKPGGARTFLNFSRTESARQKFQRAIESVGIESQAWRSRKIRSAAKFYRQPESRAATGATVAKKFGKNIRAGSALTYQRWRKKTPGPRAERFRLAHDFIVLA
jgi:hypothetical protein